MQLCYPWYMHSRMLGRSTGNFLRVSVNLNQLTRKLKITLVLLSLLILGACTKTVYVPISPPEALFQLAPPVKEPPWLVTGDLLESRDLWSRDAKECRKQVEIIHQWYIDMLQEGAKEK